MGCRVDGLATKLRRTDHDRHPPGGRTPRDGPANRNGRYRPQDHGLPKEEADKGDDAEKQ
jgi:hypothetical protein